MTKKCVWAKLITALMVLLLLMTMITGCSSKPVESTQEADEPKKAELEVIKLSIGAEAPYTSTPAFVSLKTWFIPEVAKRVAEKTNYRIEWNENWGTIAKPGQALQSVEKGLLDIGFYYSAWVPSELFVHTFGYQMPFASPSPEVTMRTAAAMVKDVPFLSERFGDYNQRLLAVGSTDNYNIMTNFPVRTLEDFKGKKIAAAGALQALLPPIGATAVAAIANEAYTSIQTGIYDGIVLPTSLMDGFKLYEVAKYYTEINMGCIPGLFLTINNDSDKKLPPEVRDIINEVSVDFVASCGKLIQGVMEERTTKIKTGGSEVFVLPQEERDKWINLLPNIPGQFAKEANEKGEPGSEVVNSYIDNLAKEGYEFPRKWEID